MLNIWNIKSRAHECARTGRPFEEGETFHTAIYFDTEAGDFMRRDVCTEAWEEETAERAPFSSWKSVYEKPEHAKAKPEIASRETAEGLLRRLIDEDQEHTEHARYILALMLERKKILVPKERKENDSGAIMLMYEHRKTGEVFILRDPELRLDEVEGVQEEVATLLGFTDPAQPPPANTAPAADDSSSNAAPSSNQETLPASG
jgi:hypothetical protein